MVRRSIRCGYGNDWVRPRLVSSGEKQSLRVRRASGSVTLMKQELLEPVAGLDPLHAEEPLAALEAAVAEAWPPDRWRDVTVLVAVSGGADSVALLRAVARLAARHPGPGRVVAAHFNHRLRPTAADDEQFVRKLCDQLNVPLEVGSAARPDEVAAEAAARAARYAYLRTTAERLGARYVAVAHTADDQAETILHRIIRGTGLAGLAGIPFARSLGPAATLVRPLLNVSRAAVLEYLAALGQEYCCDESNLSLRYTRNRIRHELLPLLNSQYNPNVADALRRLGALAGEAQRLIAALAADEAQRRLQPAGADAIILDCHGLTSQPAHLISELLLYAWKSKSFPQQRMQQQHWRKLTAAAMGEPGSGARFQLPGPVDVRREGSQLKLRWLRREGDIDTSLAGED